MVVGSKGWAERRYIREVRDVQGSSDTSRIVKDIREAFSRSNTEGHSEGVFPVEYRRTDAVHTVATSEVLRFECLSRCYPSVYSRHAGGSTLRVPVEVLSQCLQSPRRRFYAPSACRGASPWCLQSPRRRFYASSACRGAIPVPTVATSEVLRSECLSRC